MKTLLGNLFRQETLSYTAARETLQEIGEGRYQPAQIAAFLTIFNMRSITPDELAGFRDAMLELCVKTDLSSWDPIDIVGTGGDGKDTFNISTTAALVVAGAGFKVAKHGNYGVSSTSGSSDVLQYLGLKFSHDPGVLQRSLHSAGICILHAPLFHPAMKHVAAIRKELQVRTFFNIIGPVINPASPRYQLLGVYSLELARLYGHLYQHTEVHYKIVHSLDVYDEVSLTGPVKLIGNRGTRLLQPADFGSTRVLPEELQGGGSVRAAAGILTDVLTGKATRAQTDAVLANAGLAIQLLRPELPLPDAVGIARESIDSGRAYLSLKNLIHSGT
ncbi:anthranilate phosphoribosyltransferase [Chitinophaga sp. Mgbs1]|uniref:Anthranilate phosphoribosyltransferase n=1 Tax=Chitinophaga solisilvae TaxID=1233460 RepID=A0A433WNH6_9BACT|nr:anthranilate phosphoribosyltransferase [Chitinophaga solisilvae]